MLYDNNKCLCKKYKIGSYYVYYNMNKLFVRFSHHYSESLFPYFPRIVINKCVGKMIVNNVNNCDILCYTACNPYILNNPPTFYQPSKEILDSPYFTHLYKNHKHVYATLELYLIQSPK